MSDSDCTWPAESSDVRRVIRQRIENELAREILTGRLAEGDTVRIDAAKIGFTFEKAAAKPKPARVG